MFRYKGWVPNYKSMNFEQLRKEVRRLQRATTPILDKDEKLSFIAKEMALKAAVTGYRGFPSERAYEAHYSDPSKYADEIQAMDDYTREAEAERRDTGCT